MNINIRIAGEAGQGVQTAGLLLVGAFARMGLHVFCTQSYMSRIRGGLNWFDVRIADDELFSGREEADILVALTSEALQQLGPRMTPGGAILFDGPESPNALAMEFREAAKQIAGSPLMANAVAAGAVFALLRYGVEPLCEYLAETFRKKGTAAIKKNMTCARRGYEMAAGAVPIPAPEAVSAPGTTYDGSTAVGLAAATCGVKFVCSYPMTPSTGAFTSMAGLADEYGIVVEQAEDEIAAMNMVCGACYAGVPAMTTTSGGGFSLMAEGLSLAGMMELPAFIMLAQRPGPATGLPTRTGQEDLGFAVHAGHGEFARAIYAPGSVAQAYALTRVALETAHKYQTPAVLMLDQFLADQRKNVPELSRELRPIERHIIQRSSEQYRRYAVTTSGISPRMLPGGKEFVVCDSDEHTEDGHITEDLSARVRLQDKRLRKLEAMTAEALVPERYGPLGAQALLVSWGSTYGPCREAVDLLNARNHPAAMLHFAQVWPLNAGAVRRALGVGESGVDSGARIICVENNATGQFAAMLRERGLLMKCDWVLKYDGMPFTGDEIARRVTE